MRAQMIFLIAAIGFNTIGISSAPAKDIRLRLGKTTYAFDTPRVWDGKVVILRQPENEHAIYTIEDLMAAAGAELDIFVGQSADLNNAHAIVDLQAGKARRFIAFNPTWSNQFSDRGGEYRVV